MRGIAFILVSSGFFVALAAGCGGSGSHVVIPGSDARRAPALIESYGCGSCHTISGVEEATGEVGPDLNHFSTQRLIAGQLPNTPQNLIAWIRDPQAIEPGTVMPNLHVGAAQARDIAAFLYSH